MSAQQTVSPHKQQSSKHSPKSTEKTKASPNKKTSASELFGLPASGTSKSNEFASNFNPFGTLDQQIDDREKIEYHKKIKHNPSHPYFQQQLEQKVNQDSDNGKHTPKISSKSQQQAEKNGTKKAQTQQKASGNSKTQAQQSQGGNSGSNGATSNGGSKQKSCYNTFCSRDKNISSVSSPQQETTRKQGANGIYKQAKLEKSGDKVTFCDQCCSRYQEKHFCYYCQQVYFDEYNIDDREWIQCDSCDRWCHLHCEDEKIKKVYSNTPDFAYDCPRCREKEYNSSSASSVQATQPQPSVKQSSTKTKEKPQQKQEVNTTTNKTKKVFKNKEKDEKKQDQAEQNIEYVKQSTLSATPHHPSVQTSRLDHPNSAKKNNTNSTSREALAQAAQSEAEIFYSFDNFKRKKHKIFQNKNMQQQYQPVQPLVLLPNYTTIDDLLKSAGISVSLDESSIKSDLNDLKRILMEQSDSSFKSSSSNQLPNGIHNLVNGQGYSITINSE